MPDPNQLAFDVVLNDFTTKALKQIEARLDNTQQHFESFGDEGERGLTKIGRASTALGRLIGGADSEILRFAGHGIHAFESIQAALSGTGGLLGGIIGIGGALAIAYPKIIELGEAFDQAMTAIGQKLAGIVFPEIVDMLKEISELGSHAFDYQKELDAAAIKEAAFTKRLDEYSAAVDHAAKMSKLLGDEGESIGAGMALARKAIEDLSKSVTLDNINGFLHLIDTYKRLRSEQEQNKISLQDEADQLKHCEQAAKDYAKAQDEAAKAAQKLFETQSGFQGLRLGFEDLSRASKEWGIATRDAVNSVSRAISSDATNALISFGDHTKSAKAAFHDFEVAVVKDIAKIIIEMLILKLVQSALGGLGGLFGGGGTTVVPTTNYMAKGGMVPGHLVPYGGGLASGGVVTRDSLFRLREGGQNEAVVPLPDNRSIPVKFTGGGGGQTVIINYTVNAPTTASERALFEKNAKHIAALVGRETQKSLSIREGFR
jgi:lambda family phage tail tape measure protein